MPRRPATPCRWAGCPERPPGRFCDEHQRRYYQEQDRDRPSSAKRGYDAEWERIRKRKLEVDPVCEYCEDAIAVEVDHMMTVEESLARGLYPHRWENLKSACKTCHSRKTVTVDGGFGR